MTWSVGRAPAEAVGALPTDSGRHEVAADPSEARVRLDREYVS